MLYGRHRYSEARAKCLEALTCPGKSRFTHGALFFNLGLIAEATGNRAAAATYYRKSLKVRPEGVPAEKVWAALRKLER